MMYAPHSSAGLYVPIHRRTPSSSSSSDSHSPPPSPSPFSSPYTSPSSSTRSLSPSPHVHKMSVEHARARSLNIPIYTPADLLLLSTSPLARPSAELRDALKSAAPEVVQSRRQRKTLAWHARHLESRSSLLGLDGTESRSAHTSYHGGFGHGHGAKGQHKRSSSYPSQEEMWRRRV
ncbi:hypothetical protein F5I97DRAFT_1105686 [Phlebopus sp. FC_14]|nr:hypothetical protein F5I97DRAFT_1105686 [Phlebopus sp. FC_14]